ncbi:uncharacterized protein LOC134184325 isoform X2 [Corticium candelabrum]|uniref:uncharacterized protein LOC134184325 isoform X2 n=1 Tax=Corticium candelabrum TaxID=121492 RepID=UPI002E33F027|nr:uncharacterized protein LOC134184325 isoform X2 [Corticium candelabrum]
MFGCSMLEIPLPANVVNLYGSTKAADGLACPVTMGNLLSKSGDSSSVREGAAFRPDFSRNFLTSYRVVCQIGKGAFGSVYKVFDRSTNAVWCAKVIRSNAHSSLNEVKEMKKFDNCHIVQLKDVIVDTSIGHIYIVMEYCEGGTLRSWVKRNRKHFMLTESICQAVYSCHELRTIHRDLKPENVLLTRDRTIKLCDFGVARHLDEDTAAASFCGTPPYMAPEVFLSYMRRCKGQTIEGYSYKSEVWSIGCMLLDMSTVKGVFVCERTSPLGLLAAEATHGSLASSRSSRPDIQRLVEDEIPVDYRIIRRLLPLMLDLDADSRISLEAILTDGDVKRALQTPNEQRWHDSLGIELGLSSEGTLV